MSKRHRILTLYLIPFIGLAWLASAAGWADEDATGPFPSESLEFFEREVRPLLLEHCSSCHSASVDNVKGGLSLDTREGVLRGGDSGPAVVLGEPDESLLVEAVRRESFEMPPEKPLSAKALRTLERWVALGVPWSPETESASDGSNWRAERAASHWVWRPVDKPQVPALQQDQWSTRPLDRFVLSRLRQEDLTPAAQADPTTLLRRLSFDLTGLPPTLEMSREFTHLTDPVAYAQLVERLLASPQFGVRWGRHWLDLVRYAETLGHEFDFPIRNAWRYRDGVIDALNTDLPYRDFVLEHIAGDLIEPPRRHPTTGINQSQVATAWWWLGESLHAPVDIKNDWALRLDNQIDVFSKAFLGMTVACARCHDHKFDAIGVDDYYGLSGIIESSRRQYAITDPTGEIQSQQQRLVEARDEADAVAAESFRQLSESELSEWLTAFVAKLRMLDADKQQAALAMASPLVALRLLLDEQPDTFARRWSELNAEWRAEQERFDAWERESELFADFSLGLPPGWQLDLIGGTPRQSRFDWFSTSPPLPERPGVFSSQTGGRKAALTLSSPTFDVSRTHVCFKMRGKSAQSAVVVSNYFMQEFHGLLFADLRKPIDQPSDAGWVTHSGNLNKYLGHPAYLTVEDEDQAWFELEEIRFADRPPPLEQPSQFAGLMLREQVQTPEQLKRLLAQRLGEAWRSNRGVQEPLANEAIRALVKASLEHEVPLPLAQRDRLLQFGGQLQELDGATAAPTIVLATTEGTGRDAAVAVRGNPHQRGELVARGCLASLVSAETPDETSSGRWELAQSLIGEEHPLTARVMVNRVWHHLLGHGLIATPDNLGVLGGRPTHPELLDYLTTEFVRRDWSIKWLVREIVLSQTYQLSSQASERQLELDADGSLWSHRAVRRLSAEALRDAMLATAGSLDRQLGGPSVPVYLTEQMTGRGRPGQSGPLDGDNRRTTFIEVRRNFLNPFLMAFDFPMPSTAVGNRNDSNVPAQALGLLNDPLAVELARRWAERGSSIQEPRERVALMWRTAFSRPPEPDEVEACMGFVSDDPRGWIDLAHVLLNAKEFFFVK